MAQPYKHPQTGIYHLRRQIPEKLRAAFGGKALYKASLGTKDFVKASVLFTAANAELERQFEEARERLASTGDPRPSQRDEAQRLVMAYFEGPEFDEGGLDGPERLDLARREIDRGLWNATPEGCSLVAPSTTEQWTQLAGNAALFRNHPGTRRHLAGQAPGAVWRMSDASFAAGARDAQIERAVAQVARYHSLGKADLPDGLGGVVRSYLDALPIGPSQERKPQRTQSRQRPGMRLLELFDSWKDQRGPTEKSASEYRTSIVDFIDYVGDITIGEIKHDDLLNYRDEARKLPASMPRADRALSFTGRLSKHGAVKAGRIGPDTLKKRVGAVQALLSYAWAENILTSNIGTGVKIAGYKKGGRRREPFQEEDLQKLFSSRLFLDPASWKTERLVTDQTLYWMFLICFTTGARIEEVGQAKLADVKRSGKVLYIDIDDLVVDPGDEAEKHVKTVDSRRLVPIHDHLRSLDFEGYLDALANAGHRQLFPDLKPNMYGDLTQEASRLANRYIDNHATKDRRVAFHSSRHSFKDLALEAGITERIVDQICGHAPTTVGGRYGRGVRLHVLHRRLHQVDWSFVDWNSMLDAAKTIKWTISPATRPRGD
ncbi:site-specific integrase [Sphingomonas sp. PB4P5]|uniref:site-specific integrase n=1 Tax=Parasphingomonas puruogangriensis TaxID=3096155 RepID=UPI002FCA6CBE